jgi:hypothetical protein
VHAFADIAAAYRTQGLATPESVENAWKQFLRIESAAQMQIDLGYWDERVVALSPETTIVPATEYEAVLLLRRIANHLYDAGIVSDDWLAYLSANADVEAILKGMEV